MVGDGILGGDGDFLGFWGLFPAEEADGEGVDDENPEGHEGELGEERGERGVFGHDEADAVDDGGDGDDFADGLEPFGEEEGGEEGAREEHHGHGN